MRCFFLICCISIITILLFQHKKIDASSHREAPMITEDPQMDSTDLYAFVSPDRTDSVTFLLNFIPFEEPSGGPNYFKFADYKGASYRIHVDNDGDAQADISFHFQFKTKIKNKNTFLYNTGPITYNKKKKTYDNLNVEQFYRVYQEDPLLNQRKLLGKFLLVAPNNVGPKSISNYPKLAQAAIYNLKGGYKTFCGPRDDPFFISLGRTFDLLNIDAVLPGGLDKQAGKAPDTLKGYNVHTIALQVPISKLTTTGIAPSGVKDPNAIIGVWATTSRRTVSVNAKGERVYSGNWAQVSRLGMPLVNEVVIPLSHKNAFCASQPKDDGQFLKFVQNSELATIMNALFKVKVPSNPRNDLVQVFLKGVPGLNEKGVPCEYLRLNMAVKPSAKPHRLGVLAGQLDGFPNGRRIQDDVVDIALRVVAGVLDKKYNVSPNKDLGDTVVKNDKPFLKVFPYLAPPHDGVFRKH